MTAPNPILDAALDYAGRGWPVFPVHSVTADGVCSCPKGAGCGQAGKHPKTSNGVDAATTDQAQVRAWFDKPRPPNIGLATGARSGLWVLDSDPKDGGPERLAQLERELGPLPATMTASTGSGGRHYFFQHAEDLGSSQGKNGGFLGKGLDSRGTGGYVVVAPSRHRSGSGYLWVEGQGPGTAVAPIPAALLELHHRHRDGRRQALREQRPAPRQGGARYRSEKAALDAYNADNPVEWPERGGPCMVAGCPGNSGFKASKIPGRWQCRSPDHPKVGRQGDGHWWGDIADIHAHNAGLSVPEYLEQQGYLKLPRRDYGERRARPEAPPAPREVRAPTASAEPPGADPSANLQEGGPLVPVPEGEPPDGPPPPGTGDLPSIIKDRDQLRSPIAASWAAVHALNRRGAQPRVFWHTGRMGRLVETADGLKQIEIMELAAVYGVLARAANWYIEDEVWGLVDAKPDRDVAADMKATPDPALPHIEAVVSCPVVSRTGRIIYAQGYHPEDRLWLQLRAGERMPEVPANPSVEEVAAAKGLIVDELLHDMAFTCDADRANMVAAMLCPLVRPLIQDCTPLHFFSAPDPSSGKGLAADLVSITATGRRCDVQTLSTDGNEMRKRLLAILLEGNNLVSLDNIPEQQVFDSPELAAILTSVSFADRQLQFSKLPKCSTLNVTWLGSGNNPRMTKELLRRCCRIHLDRGVKDPQLWRPPEGWRIPNIRTWAREHRFEIAHALLVLAQAWLAAGRPAYRGFEPDSFETWAQVVGGILQHAEIGGFLGNFEYWLGVGRDPLVKELLEFLRAWWGKFGEQPVKGKQLLDLVAEYKLLRSVVTGKTEPARYSELGNFIKRWQGHHVDEFLFALSPDRKNGGSFCKLAKRSPTKEAREDPENIANEVAGEIWGGGSTQ